MPSPPDRTAAHDERAGAVSRAELDLQAVIEELREFIQQGRIWLNHAVWVDVEEFDQRLDQIINLLPGEIKRARRVTSEEQKIIQDARDEAQRVLEEARAEAEQILESAREEQQRLVEGSAIRQKAQEQARQIAEQAQASAREVRLSSFKYATEVTENVETSLQRLLDQIRKDRGQLDEMQPQQSE